MNAIHVQLRDCALGHQRGKVAFSDQAVERFDASDVKADVSEEAWNFFTFVVLHRVGQFPVPKPPRGSSQTDHLQVRVDAHQARQERLVHRCFARAYEVRFINDDKIHMTEHGPLLGDRTDTSKGDGRMHVPSVQACAIHTSRRERPQAHQLLIVLLNQFLDVSKDHHPLVRVILEHRFQEHRDHDALTRTRGHSDNRVPRVFSEVSIDRADRFRLVTSSLDHPNTFRGV